MPQILTTTSICIELYMKHIFRQKEKKTNVCCTFYFNYAYTRVICSSFILIILPVVIGCAKKQRNCITNGNGIYEPQITNALVSPITTSLTLPHMGKYRLTMQ